MLFRSCSLYHSFNKMRSRVSCLIDKSVSSWEWIDFCEDTQPVFRHFSCAAFLRNAAFAPLISTDLLLSKRAFSVCRQPFIETLFQYLFFAAKHCIQQFAHLHKTKELLLSVFAQKTQYFPLTKPHPIGKNIVKGIDNDFTPRRFLAKTPLLSRFVCRMRLLLTRLFFQPLRYTESEGEM